MREKRILMSNPLLFCHSLTVPVTSRFLIKKDKDLKNFVFHNKEYPNGIRIFEQL